MAILPIYETAFSIRTFSFNYFAISFLLILFFSNMANTILYKDCKVACTLSLCKNIHIIQILPVHIGHDKEPFFRKQTFIHTFVKSQWYNYKGYICSQFTNSQHNVMQVTILCTFQNKKIKINKSVLVFMWVQLVF